MKSPSWYWDWRPPHRSAYHLPVAEPKILKGGGRKNNSAASSSFLQMCTTKYMPFTRKKAAFWKEIWASGGQPPLPRALNLPLLSAWCWNNISVMLYTLLIQLSAAFYAMCSGCLVATHVPSTLFHCSSVYFSCSFSTHCKYYGFDFWMTTTFLLLRICLDNLRLCRGYVVAGLM